MTPIVTPADVAMAGSSRPRDIVDAKLRSMVFVAEMTDDDMRALAEQAIEAKNTYLAWDEFWEDMQARKARMLGFEAVLTNLDVVQVATELGTTPQKLAMAMGARAQMEKARLLELQRYWENGVLPDKDVLSETVVPICSFTVTISEVNPLTVQLVDISTNGASDWKWDFGDGKTSTQNNPEHTYATPGQYTITLISSNIAGPGKAISQTLTVGPPA